MLMFASLLNRFLKSVFKGSPPPLPTTKSRQVRRQEERLKRKGRA
ncbi:hypothetical protein [Sagittula salina]|nr:hypothetical protein [Sagittula salina]